MSTNEGLVNEKVVQVGNGTRSFKIGELYQGMRRYCHFLTQNQWDGDDLAQESISKAVKSYPEKELTPALLNKIAYHHWIDTVRKRKREIVGIDEEKVETQTELNVLRIRDIVNTLTNHLTAKQAVIFTLKDGFRFQIKEIAEVLNSSEMAIKSTLFRARNTLARENKKGAVKPISEENEQSLLYKLLSQSLQADDPQILIDNLKEIPSLVEVPVLKNQTRTQTPLNVYSMAA